MYSRFLTALFKVGKNKKDLESSDAQVIYGPDAFLVHMLPPLPYFLGRPTVPVFLGVSLL